MSKQNKEGFREPTALRNWTKGFLYIQIVMTIVAIISCLFEYRFLDDIRNDVFVSQETAMAIGDANDSRQAVVGILQLAVFVVTGILVLLWIYRANYNAHVLGASGMRFSPGWSIGWYFIPILNLWKPYQVMKEIWQASSNPQDWKRQKVSSLLPWWWFLWLTTGIAANASFRLGADAREIDELMQSNLLTQLSDLIVIALTLVLITIINRIHHMQLLYARS